MRTSTRLLTTAFAAAICCPGVGSARADDAQPLHRNYARIQHVLLLSIDGFHAVDLSTCVAAGTCPSLAGLARHGTTYANTSTTRPSDSFPGLLAQITGCTSKSTGVFYDDSYDRKLFAPAGNPPAPCTQGPGTETNI
ncbi:MAG: alkaline phosphatase family protein, partial [Xanthobacteraceae bacterium]